MSVPDQYQVRAGLDVPVWRDMGLSVGAGLRVDGIPIRDALRASDGFRRPGHILYLEPGVALSTQTPSFRIWVPVALSRSIQTSVLHAARGISTGGGLANFLVLAGYTRRF